MSDPTADVARAVTEFFCDPSVVRWLENGACAAGCSAVVSGLCAAARRLLGRRPAAPPAPEPTPTTPPLEIEPEVSVPLRSRACREALRCLEGVSAAFYNDVTHSLFVPGLLVRFSNESERPPVASVLAKPQLKNGQFEGTELSSVLDPDEQQLVFETAREVRAAIVARIKRERNDRLGYEMAAARMNSYAARDGKDDACAGHPVVYAKASANVPVEQHWASLR